MEALLLGEELIDRHGRGIDELCRLLDDGHGCRISPGWQIHEPDGRSCGFVPLWNALKHITRGCSAAQKAQLFHSTAARVYRIDLAALPGAASGPIVAG